MDELVVNMYNNNELTPLYLFRKNIYSQYGEDGIIEEILRRISRMLPLDGWCVEFGAWDGIYLSNTFNLIKNKDYKAVLIEGNSSKYKELCSNVSTKQAIKVCKYVSFSGDNTLDRILRKTSIPNDFDFLSIDIDGCDYFVFDSLNDYKPKVVCIEFNPTIPNDVEFIQKKEFSIKQGASAKSIVMLAEKKSYSLVAITDCNLFFARNDVKASIIESDNVQLSSLRDDSQIKSYIFFGYDGTVLVNKEHINMPWHRLQLDSNSLQQLPKYLRRFPHDYNVFQRIAFVMFVAVRFPKKFREIRENFARTLVKRLKHILSQP